ncbi:hypothetical protein [Dolichospermum sp. UHCC 0352]|uniref:hypothetical protein n=1 Tax=Dolichospermum sp. UHCC 0352 TaxID=2590011 RepID=UPI001C2BBCBA|nr:hypothetical protein [Dolichospermum sp. UHCC 0352]
MTTTNNAPISFRLTDDELELLRQHQEDGEKSLNLTAKRLLLNALGVDAKKPSIQVVNSVDTVSYTHLDVYKRQLLSRWKRWQAL